MKQVNWSPLMSDSQANYAEKLGITHALVEGNVPEMANVEVFWRRTLKERKKEITTKNFRKNLIDLREKFDWIAIEPKSLPLHVEAIGSNLVDAIHVSCETPLKLVHQKYLRLMRDNSMFLELDIGPLFNNPTDPKKLKNLIKLINFIMQLCPKVVIVSTELGKRSIRRYRNLQSVGEALGIPRKNTDLGPIIERVIMNKKRRTGKLISSDIEVELE